MLKRWTAQELLDMGNSYQRSAVLGTAAVWDVFEVLSKNAMTAEGLAKKLQTEARATRIILDALAALGILIKDNNKYHLPDELAELLTENGSQSVLAMLRHQANGLRRWVQLDRVMQSGKPAQRIESIRGPEADEAAFIGAMHNISAPMADGLINQLRDLKFEHLLDIGGASGTWTIAFLRALPQIKATLFDLPQVIPLARKRIGAAGLSKMVRLVGGDFYTDELPSGADFAWLGAIAHQNSRNQNRTLFAKIRTALQDQAVLVLRDVVMDNSRTSPVAGALFALNMLVATDGGGTYTFEEYRQDLEHAGFENPVLLHQDEFMNSLIRADKNSH
jgi:predicted O-methyltransferase YrrM